MAKQISDNLVEEFAKEERRTYPWDDWTNGKWWHLERGKAKDFEVEPSSFKASAKLWAKNHGYRAEVRLTQDNEGVFLRFTVDPDA